eukprot:Clim_evm10s14 gene=Clim_evmTU10s14
MPPNAITASKDAPAINKAPATSGKDWYVVLYGKKVKVAQWAKRHPGGQKVLKVFAGRDATEQFEAFHSPKAIKQLDAFLAKSEDYKEGVDLPSWAPKEDIATDFVNLRRKLQEIGCFKTNWTDEVFKMFLTMGPQIFGAYLVHFTTWQWVGTILLAFGLQQAGWLAHDYSHHSVFASPQANDRVAAFLGWTQGYELFWWKARHNTHHVVTNEVGNDPDIRTAPVFVYVKQKLNWVQKYQQYYFLPVLCLLHFYWQVESVIFCVSRGWWKNTVALLSNYVFIAWVFSTATFSHWAVHMALKGFWTASVVFSTHYGEERLGKDHGMAFIEQTVRTSRNITGGLLVDYFTGFISRQVEHHMFPMMPRVNLPKSSPHVKAFLKKYDMPFHEDSLIECIRRNIEALNIHEHSD